MNKVFFSTNTGNIDPRYANSTLIPVKLNGGQVMACELKEGKIYEVDCITGEILND